MRHIVVWAIAIILQVLLPCILGTASAGLSYTSDSSPGVVSQAGLPHLLEDVRTLDESKPSPDLTKELPSQAVTILAEIQRRQGDPLPGYIGGRTFLNREHRLPPGRYREYDVNPKVPGRNRGLERIVIEQRSGKAYYTADHYETFIPMN